ncbi:MAG TPA: F0F1 ATP synthase subunit gamma, partial [Candidatus Dormibacteraeota bacterium]|nr:F0F1 ATP synthase subunit gamma [Candidatus Dormibacteraeota bacterium]
MATLKEIRGRISSVRNIAQITRAMEMVAASRMKRAQEAIVAARPYSDQLRDVLGRLAAVVTEEVDPLLARRPVQRIGLIVVTTDRGLAGSLNANAVRSVLRWVAERAEGASLKIEVITVGR